MNIKENTTKVKSHKHINNLTYEFPGTVNQSEPQFFDIKTFNQNLSIKILSLNQEECVFDLIGVEPPLANALRRILISEIPTMAIENVSIYQNTSVIPDEVLSHRLGLIPIKADADQFNYKDQDDEHTESNSIHLKLHIANTTNTEKSVYSKDIKWLPIGNQNTRMKAVSPIHDDILVARLAPNQEIEVEMYCVKNIGREHAKWSPVCTAYYRLLPTVELIERISGESAKRLKAVCPMGVFDIEDSHAYVKDNRKCTMCRECVNCDDFKDLVDLGKVKNHFECKVF